MVSSRLQIRAFLFFHPNRAPGPRNAPALHGIVKTLTAGRLPESLWALLVIDRDGDEAEHLVTVRIVGRDGALVGEQIDFNIDRESDEVAVLWRKIPVAPIFQGVGLYLGEVLIDGNPAGLCRLPIEAA